MSAKIVRGYPPLIDEIDAAFRVKGKEVIFAWGTTIFNPQGIAVPPELMAHEAVHATRQGDDIAGWWRKYIADPALRLAEEIPAHIAEYQELCRIRRPKWTSERNMRRTYSAHVAKRLAAPLYGNLITAGEAKALLKAASP